MDSLKQKIGLVVCTVIPSAYYIIRRKTIYPNVSHISFHLKEVCVRSIIGYTIGKLILSLFSNHSSTQIRGIKKPYTTRYLAGRIREIE